MQQYTVTGMHCAACSASVEKAVNEKYALIRQKKDPET